MPGSMGESTGMASNKDAFNRIINDAGATNYEPVQTGKSMSLTVKFPDNAHVSFGRPFNEQIDNINKFLDVVAEFDRLANKIHYFGITSLLDIKS